ncbi:GH92 family glycosyl hydrolase [Amycolatopsis sp. FDAARGOS 1241]|uniref:GH92 family glycosyl hydrolase n=1 Tax=Amycolatopsis sp. FDAARGOS 1241 TaxID=2778070 RepID=UPI00194E3194|nr:GH92 family glycosyl hydrolase [Amycolatopsis sp. FDAARGOS 1241]QRP49910.1 GH92 family glycosyl hydrolase [Amycolatopsis sp. FDAARGOS 1241]
MTSAGFFSSFEAGDPQPVASEVRVGTGPDRSPTAKTGVGFTGRHALRYTDVERVVLFETDVPVTAHSALSYVVFPASDAPVPSYRSTFVALDVEFDDGTTAGFSAAAQGEGKTLLVDQWNLVRRPLGAFAGRRVKRIVLLTDPPAGGDLTGWVDDVRLGEHHPRTGDALDHVRTTRGTHSGRDFSRGNTFPATAVPHGFNFWTPVTDASALDWIYSYHRHNTEDNEPALQAVALSHQPSPWMGDRHTFHLLPGTGPVEPDPRRRALTFSHADETDRPHHYGVRFTNGLTADLAPADHAAIFRFTFPGDRGWVLFDNARNRGGLRVHPDTGVVTGHTWVRSRLSTGARRMFVYAQADTPAAGGGAIRRPFWRTVTGHLRFEAPEVTLRIATSLISLGQARRNLDAEIPAGTSFEQVRDHAREKWQQLLGRVELEGASEDELATFYSNLYRLYLYPNRGHENTPTGIRHASPVARGRGLSTRRRTGAKVVDGELYVNNGFWDTYRTTWPAYALLTPRQCGRLIDGFVQQYREGGWIARWSSPGYADLMTGTSSDVAFADAYLKGVTNFGVESAYDAALKNATVAPPHAGVGRKGLDTSPFLGYTPTSTNEGLSWALEGCLNDFGLANLADALARRSEGARARRRADNAAYLRQRAQHYLHHFDPRIGFFQGRRPNGGRHFPPQDYDPEAWGGDFVETNAWNTAFSVPHDGPGLAALHGGPTGLEAKLDTFFATPETGRKPGSYGGLIHEMTEARDVRMGQYGHSNQPSHHIPWLYAYAGAPAKLQRTVREVLRRLYLGSELGQGYPGDEDNGEMSAWYFFAALGLYPLAVGTPRYVLSAPLFRSATLHLDNGHDLVIRAPGAATASAVHDKGEHDTPYVHGLTVDGEPHHAPTISHTRLARGAVLEFDVRAEPGTWGTEPVTPAPPTPLRDLTGTAYSPDGPAPVLLDDTSRTDATFTSRTPVVDFTVHGTPREVTMYTLTSGSRDGDPSAWTLEGSDDGRRWTVLDRRSDELFRWRRQTRPFVLDTPAACAQYRLRITAATRRRVTLAQWELLAR